jgi:hypothetical protein
MAASLQQYSTTYLMGALYANPFAQSFPWENGFTRAQVLTELNNRSGQGDVSQIISALPNVGTVGAVKVASGKSSIK